MQDPDLSTEAYLSTLDDVDSFAPAEIESTVREFTFHMRELRPVFDAADEIGQLATPEEIVDQTSVETMQVFKDLLLTARGTPVDRSLPVKFTEQVLQFCPSAG